jgi:ketosteroid isomerase-like protein
MRLDWGVVEAWVQGYEQAWRSPGTALLALLFTRDGTYLLSPWVDPIEGIDAISEFWEAERASPDEPFTLRSEVLAVDGMVAVVRTAVTYRCGADRHWRNLWILRFAEDGRCSRFEEWPFAPDQFDGHES